MSLINTESWMQFGRMVGDETTVAANNNERKAQASAQQMAGYETSYPAGGESGFVVRADPVYPTRNAMVYCGPTPGTTVSSIFRKKLSTNGNTVIGGFSLFIPGTWVIHTGASARYPVLQVLMGAVGSAFPVLNQEGLAVNELFRVRYDGQTTYGIDVPQSSKLIDLGKMNYFEYRITANEIRVWLNDILVLQKAVATNIGVIGMGMTNWTAPAGAKILGGADGRFAIANWYNLIEDAVDPKVRLGPSTRVIGTKPAADVDAHFNRPLAYASNAAVAALPLDPAGDMLKASVVGTQDIYSGAADSDTASSALVHAVSVKVVSSNIDTVAHTVRPLIVSGSSEAPAPAADPVMPLNSFNTATYATTVDPATGAAWTPAAAASVKFGMRVTS